tara:strand:- start:317 stop:526 length:210 start_codon:yes stop_codon:yes gene_type:complete
MFGLGATELVIILVIVLLLFGAGRLSNIMGELGKGVSQFKRGLSDGKESEKDSTKKPEAQKPEDKDKDQ